MEIAVNRESFSYAKRTESESWLRDCITMFRDAAMSRRAATGCQTPDAIAQTALEFGIKESRGKKFFYGEILSVSREQWHAMKLAALRDCDASVRLLQERLEARRERRRQYELELSGDQLCGSGGHTGRASASGARINPKILATGGNAGL